LTKNPHIGYCPCQVGDGGQSVLSAALFRFSRAGRQAVVTTKFEFRRFTPQKKIPIISFCPQAVVASTLAGSIAYHMNLRVIDMLDLNDAHIGHTSTADLGKSRAGHEKGDGKYVLSRSPDYILMGNVAVLDKERMAKKLVRKSEHELWAEPRFHDTYELVCFQLSTQGFFVILRFSKERIRF
jgi:hypothetical protein